MLAQCGLTLNAEVGLDMAKNGFYFSATSDSENGALACKIKGRQREKWSPAQKLRAQSQPKRIFMPIKLAITPFCNRI